jgi:tetratricopeptide (TPR) repeat protein
MTSSTENPGKKIGRARRRLSQLWQAPAFLLGLFVFLGVAVSAPWRQTPQAREFEGLLAALRTGVTQDDADADLLVAQAETVLLRSSDFRSRAGEIHFLAGSAYYRQGRQKPALYAKDVWPRAAEHLEQAHTLGVADTDRIALQYRLGYALLQQGKDVQRALELLMLSVEKGAEQPLQGYQLLVQANLKLPKPNLDAALVANQRILDLTPPREVETLALARLQQGEILLRKEQRSEAVKALEQINDKAPRALRIKARLLQARCLEEDGHWDKAIAIWKELLAEAPQVDGGRARIQYQLGLAHLGAEPRNSADAIRAWSEALKLGGPEGQAAGLRLGELRLSLGEKESAQALADWKQALEKVNGPQDYRNPHIELKKVREWFDQAIRRFHDAPDPQKTQEVAELYRKIAPVGAVEVRIAEAAKALAELQQDQKAPPPEVNAQFRRAGDAYEQAAKVRPEAERPGLLWRSGQCYLAAKEAALTQKILHQYVKIEPNEMGLAEGWCILGDLYRGEGKKDFARDAYHKVLQYPNTPFACKARFFLALDEIEKKNFTQAYTTLKENVEATGEVDRVWQEKSQFKLASLLMQLKKYPEARIHLTECLRVFAGNANALTAREQLGECYRKLAEQEEAKEKEIAALILGEPDETRRLQMEETQRAFHVKRIELLNKAVKTYEDLKDELRGRPAGVPLSNLEQILLRRAWFGIGECRLDHEEFFEAKEAFRELQVAHRKTLEGFYASLRICNLPELIPNKRLAAAVREEAKESLRLLSEDLKALNAEHEIFHTPGVSSRADWLRWTEAMQQKLNAAPK